jgi:hypothetical protein|tara:strand:- start:714 stop:1004 length:291 start_codon:yes stop_codon:yes gene_type:complete
MTTSIAKIIHSQIKAIDFWALGAWGAKTLVAHPDGLSFKTSGAVGWKGTVKVTLDEGKDLYIVKFFRIRKMQVIVDKIVEDVFCEDLVNTIDCQVR